MTRNRADVWHDRIQSWSWGLTVLIVFSDCGVCAFGCAMGMPPRPVPYWRSAIDSGYTVLLMLWAWAWWRKP